MLLPVPLPPAGESELRSVANLIQTVFNDTATTAAHQSLVDVSGFDPACLPTIWNESREAVATVQAAPCDVALLETWIPAGIITMVATAQHARGRGYMRACLNAAHNWLLAHERPLGILYGVPAVYPKFGYRPVMPNTEIRYPAPAFHRREPSRPANHADLEQITSLFNAQEISRPCSVRRVAERWLWTSPHDRTSIKVLEENDHIVGYLRCLDDASSTTVMEAACRPGRASALLDAIHTHANQSGRTSIVLTLMPDHPLAVEVARRATSLALDGVEIRITPPRAGMLCVLDGGAALRWVRRHIDARLDTRSLRIRAGAKLDVRLGSGPESVVTLTDPDDLAHLLSGYPGVRQLRQWGLIHGDDRALALAEIAFPAAWPRWTTEPFWGA